MTEEIIIFEQDGNIVGITKEGKYFESYKTTANVAILRGAGLYIKRLEQREKALTEIADNLQKRNHDLTLMNERLEQNINQLTQWLDEARNNADFWCNKCTNLEQENKDLKKQIESDKGLITVSGKQQYQYLQKIDELEQENKELKCELEQLRQSLKN